MGKESVIVDMIGYDKDGHSVYTQLGNGTETTYAYDRERRDYNHAGECVVKSHGDMEGVYINGAPQGITFHETDEFTLYPASIISVNKNRFTKHYFIGDKRIASRIGTGRFNNVYGRNGSYVTAGQQDYAERLNQIESQKEDYYKELGIAPGVPTMKGAYGDPENTGVGYNTIITELGDHSVPEGWIQTPRPNTTPDTEPGAPISWNDPQTPENPDAGYHNVQTGFRSFFLSFDDNVRLEVMTKPQMTDGEKERNRTGFIHLSFNVGSKEQVDTLTAQLKTDGFEVTDGPRTTDDGYYES